MKESKRRGETLRHAWWMCRSMFCALPCPRQIWDEDARPLLPLFLPAVGLEMGGLWALLALILRALSCPAAPRAILLAACPFLLTGFLHLDGFMDVADAIGSWRPPERRREILKDPHTGSVAVAGCVLVALGQFAALLGADPSPWLLLLLPGVSRCCSALGVTLLPPMAGSQYEAHPPARQTAFTAGAALAVLIAAGFLLCGARGLCLPAGALCAALCQRGCVRALGGMNGDIAGFSLTLGELCALLVLALL